MLRRLVLLLACIVFPAVAYPGDDALPLKKFLSQHFNAEPVQASSLWVSADLKRQIHQLFDYRVNRLRVRYWRANERTAWVLEEIGKEQPITMGVVVEDAKVVALDVLAYRESRGGEICYSFFLDQFKGLRLATRGKNTVLSGHIDGITGATLSVNATKKIALVALFLHKLALSPEDTHAEWPTPLN